MRARQATNALSIKHARANPANQKARAHKRHSRANGGARHHKNLLFAPPHLSKTNMGALARRWLFSGGVVNRHDPLLAPNNDGTAAAEGRNLLTLPARAARCCTRTVSSLDLWWASLSPFPPPSVSQTAAHYPLSFSCMPTTNSLALLYMLRIRRARRCCCKRKTSLSPPNTCCGALCVCQYLVARKRRQVGCTTRVAFTG